MNFTEQNFFQLFDLPERFAIDLAQLQTAYHLVQEQVHPDRYVTASAATRRLAQQWATYVNEGYLTLRKPSLRARYLCGLRGVELNTETHTAMPLDFLEQQIEWRETQAEALANGEYAVLSALFATVSEVCKHVLIRLESEFDQQKLPHRAAATLHQLMFIEKFSSELEEKLKVLKTSHGTATN